MAKLLLTGVDGNLGGNAADILLTLEPKENLIFCGYNPASLEKYAEMGVETHVTNFNNPDGLIEAFKGADALALISMPFVGPKRQNAQRTLNKSSVSPDQLHHINFFATGENRHTNIVENNEDRDS